MTTMGSLGISLSLPETWDKSPSKIQRPSS